MRMNSNEQNMKVSVKPFLIVIGLLCALNFSGCMKSPVNPYLRDLQPAYSPTGTPLPTKASIEIDYLNALLADLDACYKEAR